MTVQTHQNPVIPGKSRDPSVCSVDNDYVLVTSSFENSRLLSTTFSPVRRSSHLPEPHQAAYLLKGTYGATLPFIMGTFYIITTNESAVDQLEGSGTGCQSSSSFL
ncbi:hypothetical protein BJ742DRAFT_772468 [Cladochytrium replicatum]|nr:hypothetical protein BJ742DRAFT_772468 [Cladochytrium replicatum]